MSLRLKVIVILLAVFGLYATLVYGIQNLAIMPSFQALESDEASKNLDRALRAIEREIELLSPSVSDWAHWDDTYQFATDRNADYVEANLAPSTLEGLHVNVMNFYDRAGNLIWGRAQELDSGTEIRLGDLSASRLPPDHLLLRHNDVGSVVSGIFMSKRGPLLTVSKPILKTDGAGPINGTVVLGRFLDSQAVARLAKQAQVDLRVSLNPGEGSAAHWQQENGGLRHTGAEIEERGTVSRAQTIVADLTGQAALLLQVDTPRDITARGRTAVHFSLISIFGAGVLVLLVLLGLLQRTVVSPVARLTRQASDIGERGDLTARVSVHRNDEVGILAREFDRMVERLGEARRKLLEQSYQAGIAEMASGVLHNAGNAITPVNVKLAGLSREFRDLPVAEIQTAVSELDDQGTPTQRRADLLTFTTMAAREMAELARGMPEKLDEIARHVRHVESILADQEHYSRASRVVEAVDLGGVVRESLALLAPELCGVMTAKIEPGVRQRVLASPVALQQVVSNLVINAAEAIRRAGRRDSEGRLHVSADTEKVEGIEMVHARFQDNGAGISPEHLQRIFERGFSTKQQRASGLGLHWTGNTVTAMNGRIYAQSEGAGKGACLHLLLPSAVARPETQPN